MTLSTKFTTTSELPLLLWRITTLTMAYHHFHPRMLYLLPLLFLLRPHPCITAASWIIASLDYHCLFGPQPLFGLPRYFWITAVSTYQTKQAVTPISAFFLFFLPHFKGLLVPAPSDQRAHVLCRSISFVLSSFITYTLLLHVGRYALIGNS